MRRAQLFGIHPLTVEDIVTRSDREKCEQYDNYTFIVSRALVDFDKCVGGVSCMSAASGRGTGRGGARDERSRTRDGCGGARDRSGMPCMDAVGQAGAVEHGMGAVEHGTGY